MNPRTPPALKRPLLLLAALLVANAGTLSAETLVGGPKGGRLLETEPLRAELFVGPERKVEVIFYDSDLKPAAPGAQSVRIVAEPKTGRTPVDLEPTPTGFASKAALPPGEPYRLVVQAYSGQDARPKNFRIDLDLEACGECKRAEYACICEGH